MTLIKRKSLVKEWNQHHREIGCKLLPVCLLLWKHGQFTWQHKLWAVLYETFLDLAVEECGFEVRVLACRETSHVSWPCMIHQPSTTKEVMLHLTWNMQNTWVISKYTHHLKLHCRICLVSFLFLILSHYLDRAMQTPVCHFNPCLVLSHEVRTLQLGAQHAWSPFARKHPHLYHNLFLTQSPLAPLVTLSTQFLNIGIHLWKLWSWCILRHSSQYLFVLKFWNEQNCELLLSQS